MPICRNCGGSNKKVVLNYTPKSYTICPDPGTCPESYLCSEILDTACIQYTAGDILYCGTNFSVVDNSESLENALQNILDLVCRNCALKVDIISNPEEESLPSLTTEITNGQEPYTYQWEIAQGEFVGHFISGSAALPTLTLTCIAANSIMTGDIDKNIKVTNVELTVIDANGCKETVHFVYASDCYSMIVTEPQQMPQYLGGRLVNFTNTKTKLLSQSLDFMDDPAYMPTCTEIKNMCCIECFQEGGQEGAASNYRRNRDEFLKNTNENLLNEFTGSASKEKALNYTQWAPGNLADQLIIYKGGLLNYNVLSGCPECSFRIWSEIKWSQLDNKTLAEIFPMIDPDTGEKFVWIDAVFFGETPPVGQPGQMLKWQADPLSPNYFGEYAWDPRTNTWSETLGDVISELNVDTRERRDAWLKSLNEVILATTPFVWANDYALFHRYKYELKYTV
jgi:hypothetical protein